MASVSDVKVNWIGSGFTLRAGYDALALLEQRVTQRTGKHESFAVICARVTTGVPLVTDVTDVFAALALPRGEHYPAALLAAMPLDDGAAVIEGVAHIQAAFAAARPPAKAGVKPEDGKPESDPQ